MPFIARDYTLAYLKLQDKKHPTKCGGVVGLIALVGLLALLGDRSLLLLLMRDVFGAQPS
jgi:hypothetical protein